MADGNNDDARFDQDGANYRRDRLNGIAASPARAGSSEFEPKPQSKEHPHEHD